MSVSELSASTQNYLKAIWGLTEWSTQPVTPTLIAQRTGLKISSVSDAVRKMASQGLVDHEPYGAVGLTEAGRGFALAMVRRHRLIESFLVRELGYSWDQVHDEAESLEHAVSDFMIDRIDELLGFPTRDPHGDPIPSADGSVSIPDARQLTEVGAGTLVVVERISDADPALLQLFEGHGIVVGATLVVGEGSPYSGTLNVRVEEAEASLDLGTPATDALYVSLSGT
ncbi:metal-dependent transcriptional regulator [Cellulomonas sp. APG4]|uniref:metal-dependent transcriptional regulator n=1 Tax=Cellulomonas sp. APG4 TaxID=1538656 RepID=UPI00137B8CEC|nr:metal-dependent transcriptional regulator [Cellulomonas sp. APG4]NCT91187.1 metal-dependent transcriptional regulator [Cellulomonas sp. APG4]